VAVVIVDGRILLMHRSRDGHGYVTLPGGKVKSGETAEAACLRELAEETGLAATVGDHLWDLDNLDRTEHYFLMADVTGTVRLGGPEAARNSPANSYRLDWHELSELPQLDLLPTEVRDRLTARFGG
jgi:8-oxo-dGTP pyrophosphatase MutT (NUDIX family)